MNLVKICQNSIRLLGITGKDVIGNNNILIGHQAGKNLGTTINIFMIADEKLRPQKCYFWRFRYTTSCSCTTNLSPTRRAFWVLYY